MTQHSDQYPKSITRREFVAGLAALGLFGIGSVKELSDRIEKQRWPADAARLVPVERAPDSQKLTLVYGGFGQKCPENAARELARATIGQQDYYAMSYPNQGFTINDLASPLISYIVENRVRSLNVVGVSMGMQIAVLTMQAIENYARVYPGSLPNLPKINYFAAYSSPADASDAIDPQWLSLLSDVTSATQFNPKLVSKFLYSLLDGDGDPAKAMHIDRPGEWSHHIMDTLEQTFNNCAPGMALSQLQVLAKFNAQQECLRLKELILPGITRFFYCMPSNFDPTVNNHQAVIKYREPLRQIGVPTIILNTGATGHANTASAGLVLGRVTSFEYPYALSKENN